MNAVMMKLLVALAVGCNALAPAQILSRRGIAKAAGAGVAALVAPQVANAKGKAMPPKAAKKESKKAEAKTAAPDGVALMKTLFVRGGV
jgi:hypothetical protein